MEQAIGLPRIDVNDSFFTGEFLEKDFIYIVLREVQPVLMKI